MSTEINKFLDNIKSSSMECYEIILAIRALFHETNSLLDEEIKYGGLTFSLSKNLIGGIYSYKEHISIEFSYGAHFTNPHESLEGGGKGRRHIKIRNKQDIKSKHASFYIQESMNHLPF